MMPTLRELREARGVRLKAVADHLGVTRQTYAEWERDVDLMRVGDAKRVAEFLREDVQTVIFADKAG